MALVLVGRRKEPLYANAEMIGAGGGNACVIVGDVSRAENATRIVAAAGQRFGSRREWLMTQAVLRAMIPWKERCYR